MSRIGSRRNLQWLSVLATSGIFLATISANARAEAEFRARGNEPGWSVSITGTAIELKTMDGKSFTVSPVPQPTTSGAKQTYAGTADGKLFSVIVTDAVCVDNMSGMPHPKSVSVKWGELALTGCGGEPASLLQGDWIIQTLNGKAVTGQGHPTLSFDAKGGLSGGGICNRFFGGYELSGEGLTIGGVGSTQMACEQNFMDEESQFLKSLGRVNGFTVSPAGILTLKGQDAAIELRKE